MISLRLLGGASLESDGAALRGPAAQRHRLALLSLLCVSHPRALSRDKLVGYLWPGRDAEPARNLLKQAVHVLRKTLGDAAILSAGDDLHLGSPPLDCDVFAFQSALAAGDREGAIGLYAGPLLDGFFLSEAPEFESWLDQERERFRQSWRTALGELATEKSTVGEVGRAVQCWRRLLLDDPYDARVTLRLMEALEAAGDRAGALRQARLHEILLEQDFGAGPDPAVHALAERIRGGYTGDDPASSADRQSAGAADEVIAPDGSPMAAVPVEGTAAGEKPGRPSWGGKRAAGLIAALLVLGSLAWVSARSFHHPPSRVRSIAVLPLANQTGDPGQDHFVAGMHDALISELAQVESLTVYSRQSVLRYEGSDLPLPVIAEQLGVDALVEGMVFMSGDTVRVSVQVVRAHPEEHLASFMLTNSRDRALSLQGSVARAVADSVRVKVTPEVRARLARNRSVNPAAQEAFLAGLYHLEYASYGPRLPATRRTAELRLAIAKLEEAVALDSTWARAYAKLALADHWLASTQESVAGVADEYYPKAKAAALRALELDNTESWAYASLGFVLFRYEHDWAGAEQAIRRAVELDPNSHHWIYAIYLMGLGRYDEAIGQYQMATERDPLSDLLKTQIAGAYACANRHQEAIAQVNQLQARAAPGGGRVVTPELLKFLVDEYSLIGAHAQAIELAQRLVATTDTLSSGPELAFALAMAGRHDQARSVLARVAAKSPTGHFSPYPRIYVALGDTDRAIAAMRASIDSDYAIATSIRCWTAYQLLRDDPRMQALVSTLDLPN